MIIDARQIPDSKVIETEICVVGAGAAGISFAVEFDNQSTPVCLIESGGFELDGDTQALYQGEVRGRDYHSLDSARLRYFGGSTNCWHGWCRALDEIDFEERPFIEHSGWPISLSDLEPFYVKARKLCQVKDTNLRESVTPIDELSQSFKDELPKFFKEQVSDDDRITSRLWQVSPPTRFGPTYRDTIENSKNVSAYLYANVVEIETNDDGSSVTQLRLATLQGTQFWIRAKHFVLASGGIEVPRLLLASNSAKPAGLGNDFDQVGRYFMLHPHLWVGRILANEPIEDLATQRFGTKWRRRLIRAGVGLSAKTQKTERLPNHVLVLREMGESEPKGIKALINAMVDKIFGNSDDSPDDSSSSLQVLLWTDHLPNPDSRVTLDTKKDQLGVPLPILDWRFSPGEKQTIRKTVELFGETLGALNVGRLQLDEWLLDNDEDVWPEQFEGDYHHMGATRMSSDPRHGVVDANCRVHGINNLYVASSSVFATAGSASPTLTIVALSLRLADHIKHLAES